LTRSEGYYIGVFAETLLKSPLLGGAGRSRRLSAEELAAILSASLAKAPRRKAARSAGIGAPHLDLTTAGLARPAVFSIGCSAASEGELVCVAWALLAFMGGSYQHSRQPENQSTATALDALGPAIEKGSEFNMCGCAPGRLVSLMHDVGVHRLFVAAEIPAIAICTSGKLSEIGGHSQRSSCFG
jgi:hypothetical protein